MAKPWFICGPAVTVGITYVASLLQSLQGGGAELGFLLLILCLVVLSLWKQENMNRDATREQYFFLTKKQIAEIADCGV